MLYVEHADNRQRAPEEAERIASRGRAPARRRDVSPTAKGSTRELTLDDILVVAPYNTQVRCLREHLPEGARIGTVDKFQGQQAPVVFFSMTSSSGEDVPRGMDFLFSRNRLNVAVSRAQALSVVVCSPSLLWARCNTVEQMRLVNALCRFADDAQVVVALSRDDRRALPQVARPSAVAASAQRSISERSHSFVLPLPRSTTGRGISGTAAGTG